MKTYIVQSRKVQPKCSGILPQCFRSFMFQITCMICMQHSAHITNFNIHPLSALLEREQEAFFRSMSTQKLLNETPRNIYWNR